eukprot:jgi/Ulvmu1/1099/UM106_0016.1
MPARNIFALLQAYVEECTPADHSKLPDAVSRLTEENVLKAAGELDDITVSADGLQGKTCLVCGVAFGSLEDQRAHFKSDWHRLNVRRKLKNIPCLSEEDAARVIDDGVSSISGSDSDSEDQGEGRNAASAREPRSVFEHRKSNSQVPDRFSVWNCVLFQDTPGLAQGPAPSPSDRHDQLVSVALKHGTWAVVLSSGGHFAAGMFDMRGGASRCPLIRAVNVSRTGEWPIALEHKTLHRYVTRAGQGGRQSNQDRTGKVANSAGSALRRYNETALSRDVAAILTSWAPRLAAADAVFVNAPGASAAPVADALAAAGVDRRDARLRRVPFPTARPTFRELRRTVLRLASADDAAEGPGAGTGGAGAPASVAAAPAERAEHAAAAAEVPGVPEPPQQQQAVAGIWAEPEVELSEEAMAEAKAKAAKAEKRARQKAREKAKKAAAAAAKKEAERQREAAAAAAAEDPEEVARALAEVQAAMASRKKGKGPAKQAAGSVSRGEDASVAARRERMAAAAEARARALQAASAQQQLW